jgi:hypothetical protein
MTDAEEAKALEPTKSTSFKAGHLKLNQQSKHITLGVSQDPTHETEMERLFVSSAPREAGVLRPNRFERT